jgi:hypothetical protein
MAELWQKYGRNYGRIMAELGQKSKLSRSAFFDEKSIPFHERYPHSP